MSKGKYHYIHHTHAQDFRRVCFSKQGVGWNDFKKFLILKIVKRHFDFSLLYSGYQYSTTLGHLIFNREFCSHI